MDMIVQILLIFLLHLNNQLLHIQSILLLLYFYSCSSDVYDLKLFTSYLKDCYRYLISIHILKLEIKKYTFNDEALRVIKERKNYYNFELKSMIKNNPDVNLALVNLQPPNKESCYRKCTRLLFTNLPSPYRYDFCLDCSPTKARINVVLQIKQRFGYSKRSSSTCFMSFSTSRSTTGGNKDSNKENHESKQDKLPSERSNFNIKKFSLVNPVNRIVPYPSTCSK